MEHQKSFETFTPPPILTISLKRFQGMGARTRKLQTMVEFPIYNLDLSNYVYDYQFLASQGISCQYDLCGVINHYGSLTFGHYVSVCKNPYDGMWYKYDDTKRIPIPESQISKEAAYILFYIRKDTLTKKLSDIFPSINENFPGKPVRTKYGEGFILGKSDGEIDDKDGKKLELFYVMIRDETHEMSRNDIYQDPDSNEIVNDQALIDKTHKQMQSKNEEIVIDDRPIGQKIISALICSTANQKKDKNQKNQVHSSNPPESQGDQEQEVSQTNEKGEGAPLLMKP